MQAAETAWSKWGQGSCLGRMAMTSAFAIQEEDTPQIGMRMSSTYALADSRGRCGGNCPRADDGLAAICWISAETHHALGVLFEQRRIVAGSRGEN